ncbi:hypothetical protein FGE12_08405 [Aggregicoccus sp. 17bor-14]|uniref:hypothetical protein n=1 Tax=Myxococcaceae TaxID=31 RepID=UPI00129C83A5|nr:MULTISPECIES: hypothetical protein [Myxococcaceae]MBF5042419.1 hypothetical protein [Simulacricoccus sp. 17bor-14]MRI88191.1 hypothetical protein [Aggregicoccus sp. 17bor-14]
MSARTASLVLALAAGALGCNVVDPVASLHEFTDSCTVRENCSDGFVCAQGHCVTGPGDECREGFKVAPCELTAGVCAGVERVCLPSGRSEATCSGVSYGPTYEVRETTCGDGLDNDCDGLPDARRGVQLAVTSDSSLYLRILDARVVRFGAGYLAAYVDHVWLAPTNSTPMRKSVAYRVLDAKLGLAGKFAQTLGLYAATMEVHNLQVIPYDAGAFITWTTDVPDPADPKVQHRVRKVSRVDVGGAVDGSSVGIAERELSLPTADPYAPVRAAVANDHSSVVFTWLENGVLVGQAFGMDLKPLSGKVTLSAPGPGDSSNPSLNLQDISPQGSSGYALGWSVAGWSNGSRNAVRFRTASSSLDQLGEVTGADAPGTVNDLRLLATLAPSDEPLAAWLTTSSTQGVTASAVGTGVVVARPFSPEGTIRPPVGLEGVSQLNVVRVGDGLLMTYPEPQGDSEVQLVRHIAADGTTSVRQLDSGSVTGTVTLLPDVDASMWTGAYIQSDRLRIGATCH